jgi:serine/threonine-protein kinase
MAVSSIKYTIGEPMPGTKWVVRGTLGQGGMGVVLDVVKARLIEGAMKVLLPPFAKLPEVASRFLGEVKVTARLQHPNIVQLLDFDRLEDGTPFMVMERLRGRTLRTALRETRQRGKAWTAANTYAVAAQVAEGLYRAHSHVPSIVHRDIKPDNLYLHRTASNFESVVKVMDFGVAAVVGECDGRGIGTVRYMAPEQVAGDAVSSQTDQYALALVVYEMLTGRLPWDVNARDASALADVRLRAAPMPASRFCPWLPSSMDTALLKALAKAPAARHDTLHGLIFELRGLQWIDDRSEVTGDTNPTDPMAGFFGDGGAVVREQDDTFERASTPAPEGPSIEAPELTASSGVSVQFSEPFEGPGGIAASASREAGPKAAQEIASEPHAPAANDRSEPQSAGRVSRRTIHALAFALVGSGAVMAVLVSAGMAGSPGESSAKGVTPVTSQAWSASLAASDPGAEAPRPTVDAIEARSAPVDSVVPPPSGSTTQPVVAKVSGTRPVGGPGGLAVRKVAAAPPQTPRGASAKVAVPDDGREFLYVPGER